MFQWALTLSDKQVMMLMAFYRSEPNQYGCQFHGAHHMIGDAWDIRAVRKLQESGLMHVREQVIDGLNKNIWTITMKGRLIAEAIMEDASGLANIQLRNGLEGGYAINRTAVKRKTKKSR
jgi:hypothetical protein